MLLKELRFILFGFLTIQALPYPPVQELDTNYWLSQGQEQIVEILKRTHNVNRAKNVILFLGDGMGPPVVTAGRIYKGQTEHLFSEQQPLAFEKFPNVGLAKTYSVDVHTTDSASSATAFLSGVKAHLATIGVGAEVQRGDCVNSLKHHTESIASWAIKEDKWAGFVTNTRVTHATPSSLYAHSADRDWESNAPLDFVQEGYKCKDIAMQMIENFPGNNLRVMMGGGRKHFIPDTEMDFEVNSTGVRTDGRNLIAEWINRPYRKFVWNRTQLMNVDLDSADFLLGLFEYDQMRFEAESRHYGLEDNPTLEEMTAAAIKILSRKKEGFFLLVEGGRIDHGLHQNRAKVALEEVKAFERAIETGLRLTNQQETLIVVTADHSHSVNLIGYPHRNTSITGKFMGQDHTDGLPSTLLVFADGPSAALRTNLTGDRRNLTSEDTESIFFLQPALIPGTDDSHGGEEVAVYANGPFSHLFLGVFEQNYIAHAMAYAMCVGVSKDLCLNTQGMHKHEEETSGSHTSGTAVAALVFSILCFMLLIAIIVIFVFREISVMRAMRKTEDSRELTVTTTASNHGI